VIKFLENSDKKLSFAVYPVSRIVGWLAFIIILLPFIYWGLFISPVYSSLECQRTNKEVNCLLTERKAIALKSQETEIEDVRDIDGIWRGLLNNKQIVIRANSKLSLLSSLGYRQKYYYPSTANTLIYLNFQSGFDLFEQRSEIGNFVRGKTNADKIKVDLKLGWFTLLFIMFLSFLFLSILLNLTISNQYDFDGENKILKLLSKRIILNDLTQTYSFEEIDGIVYNRNESEKVTTGTIVIKLSSGYDLTSDPQPLSRQSCFATLAHQRRSPKGARQRRLVRRMYARV